MKTIFLTLVLVTSLLSANEKEKTEEELIAEFMQLEEEIKDEKAKTEKLKKRSEEIRNLSKTVNKLSKTLGVE